MTISDNMQTYFDKLRDKFQFQVDILDQIYLIQETRQLDFRDYLQLIANLKADFLQGCIASYPSEKLTNNEYYKNIKMPNKSENGYRLSNGNILPSLKVHWLEESSFDIDKMQIKPKQFTCYSDLDCPMIFDEINGICWMSVEPGEINSFGKIIKDAKGNVLLFGLGLGYATYMISQKEDVDSVTVVETDKNVINLFNKYLKPQFPNKEKINIVKADAFEYMDETDLNKYDYVNLDIWMNVMDMLPIYLKALPYEKKYPNVKFSYWLEDELKCKVQQSVVNVAVGLDKPYDAYDEIGKHILGKVHIDSEDKFKEILKLENFREKMYDFYTQKSDSLIINVPEFPDVMKMLYDMFGA